MPFTLCHARHGVLRNASALRADFRFPPKYETPPAGSGEFRLACSSATSALDAEELRGRTAENWFRQVGHQLHLKLDASIMFVLALRHQDKST